MRSLLPLLLIFVASGQLSAAEWSQPSPHHSAVVRVTSGTSGGSGVYVQQGQITGVLTARHVIESWRDCRIEWSDGTRTTGTATVDRDGHDLAWITTTHASVQPLFLADRVESSQIEICGYGGPQRRLRHMLGRLIGSRSGITESNCEVTSGDSGGPWFSGDKVIGIQSTGGEPVGQYREGWPRYGTSQAVALEPIRAFVRRVEVQMYPPQGPSTPYQRPDLPPSCPPIDYDELARRVIELIRDDPDYLELVRGPAGPPGAPGPPGLPGPVGPMPDLDDLPPITIQLLDPKGEVMTESTKGLGEVFRLRLVPGDPR